MINIVCAACKSVIGVLDSEDHMDEHADIIATAHSLICTATPEQKEQAIYDLKFREMTKELGL